VIAWSLPVVEGQLAIEFQHVGTDIRHETGMPRRSGENEDSV
jgi:hypothetical protein